MEIKLDQVKGIGPNLLRLFRSENIWSTYDLVLRYPKRYEDFSIGSLDFAKDKEQLTLRAIISSEPNFLRFAKGNRIVFEVNVFDEVMDVVVFGRGYLVKQLHINDEVVIKGIFHLYRKQIVASSVIKLEKLQPIKPIYGIEGIYDKTLSNLIGSIFENNQVQIFETLPQHLISKYHFNSRKDAYEKLHLPKRYEDIRHAKERFKYEEAFHLQLKLLSNQLTDVKRVSKNYDLARVKALIASLPYELTQGQKDIVNDIFRDFKKDMTCYRLIQGDVGSGKTMIAALAMYAVITAGEQVALMAPTDILANQHHQFLSAVFKDVRIALLTSKSKEKKQIKQDIENHSYDLIVGTHALVEENVIFENLGLVVIDEQHKFGVQTRDELIKKAHAKDVLYLTATPIPRTLAMVAFGESHVSTLLEKPKQRIPVETRYILKKDIEQLYGEIKKKIDHKEHVFLVVPAISSTHVDDNIQTVYEDIKTRFEKEYIFVLHGQLKDDEKDVVMRAFIASQGGVLIATTMIEVGIDIPTATLIAIFSAEHFGLSQLHQLRGRVGRGSHPGTCYLISQKEDLERLELLASTNDGFQLSEYDLQARGPGDFLGNQQSGYLQFNFLNLQRDFSILIKARADAETLMKQPDFKTNPRYKYLNKYITESLKI
ncbi:MAG: ATP-dependent DNA helicase RecG [Acholeplasmataceae bacterium]|nr:ATP-dependent DNA helicase RecG [Acholeplasmataceae bacterium]